MYENQTYEAILARMLDRVHEDYPNLDDREGSVIFNALAPAAMELAIAYTELDNIRNESFVSTASREYLLLACRDMGVPVDQFNASPGEFKGEFDAEVEVGSVWNCDLYNFTVISLIAHNDYYEYRLVCDTLGTAPNGVTGSLTPVSEAPRELTHAELVACLIEGENEKTDEQIRETYYEFVNSSVSDGNVAQYRRWCDEYDGIGGYRIIPLWDGANTVKVSILTASNHAVDTSVSPNLVEEFQEYLDPVDENGDPTGMGDGVAPIGAFVTVCTAEEVPISVSAQIAWEPGYDDTSTIDTALTEFFASLAYDEKRTVLIAPGVYKTRIAFMSLGAAILDVDGVDFITDLLINGDTDDVELTTYQIPVLGETEWTVSGDV